MLAMLIASDAYTFQKHIKMLGGRNIQLDGAVGTKIGTGVNQKLGFFGNAPVVQQNAINSPSGGATVDAQARQAAADIITALQNLGLIAT